MTLIEMMLGNFQTEQGIAITRMGAQSTRKSEETGKESSFVDILNSSMNNAGKSVAKKAGFHAGTFQKETNFTSEKSDSTPIIRSFREANDYNRRLDKTMATDSTRADKCSEKVILTQEKSPDTDTASGLNNPENMIQIVAQLMGLEVRELQKLLNEAGLTPESFGSLENISEVSADLAQILGLNNSQQKTLEIMLQTAAVLIGESAEKANEQSVPINLSSASENQQPKMAAAPEKDIGASSIQTQTPVEQLSEQIRLKLDEYGIRLEEGENSVQEDIKALILPLLEKTAPKVQLTTQGMAQVSVENPEIEPTTAGTEEMSKESGSQADAESGQSPSTVRLSHQANAPVASNAEQTQPVFSSIIQANQAVDAIPVTNTVSAPANAKEILGQIIEKAQIIMTPDKSEMVMELKPDSLGKISLKLVTENGIVMAKFVAENQQVKEVLETNMQLLKDSLQQQGLDVQGFSVSVGQDSNRSGRNNWQDNRASSFLKEPITGVSAREGQMPVLSEAAGNRNPYLRETSTIELSA